MELATITNSWFLTLLMGMLVLATIIGIFYSLSRLFGYLIYKDWDSSSAGIGFLVCWAILLFLLISFGIGKIITLSIK